ncbi:hypothetical protein Ciccas_005839 [Cichlidogyrus casuarinus]|uniref:Phosphoserine phosphatase n=1 Tax=Cichlidogyrus casuarinus TaxID=1844966 RepID=A0ABD2Q7I3_9PLAT
MHAAHSAEQHTKTSSPHQQPHRYMNFFNFHRQSSTSLESDPAAEDPCDLDTWRDVRAIAFDVDSTVTVDEAIDELAKFIGCGEQVVQMYVDLQNHSYFTKRPNPI